MSRYIADAFPGARLRGRERNYLRETVFEVGNGAVSEQNEIAMDYSSPHLKTLDDNERDGTPELVVILLTEGIEGVLEFLREKTVTGIMAR